LDADWNIGVAGLLGKGFTVKGVRFSCARRVADRLVAR
jgi:hypothetical protein